MNNINEFLKNKKELNTEQVDQKVRTALIEYAEYYGYDANKLMASIIWLIYSDCCINKESQYKDMNPEEVKETWKDAYLKAQDIVG